MILSVMVVVAAVLTAWLHPYSPLWAEPERLPADAVRAEGVVGRDDVLWLDARSFDAYQEAHWPGALWCSEDDWAQAIGNVIGVWSPDRLTVVYCDGRACEAARSVRERLQFELGDGTVKVLHGGWPVLQALLDRAP